MGEGNTPRLKRLLGVSLACILATGLGLALWQIGGSNTRPNSPTGDAQPTPGVPWFEDVTSSSGIRFLHFDPRTEHYYIQETIGSGLAWIDYDNDGWLDLFCVQDGPLKPEHGTQPTSKLFRNNGDGTFTDVTEQVGLARAGFGMGCAVGD